MGLGAAPPIMHQQATMMQQQSHSHGMHFEHLEQHQQGQQGGPVMDEFLDQMFSMPACFDMGPMGGGRVAWDYNAPGGQPVPMGVENTSASAQKLYTMSLMTPGLLNGVIPNQLLSGKEGAEGIDHTLAGARMQHQHAGPVQGSTQTQSQQPQPSAGGIGEPHHEPMDGISQEVSNPRGRAGATGEGQAAGSGLHGSGVRGGPLMRSPSLGSSGSEDSGTQQQAKGDHSPPLNGLMWRQPYVGGGVPPLPMALAQAKAESTIAMGEINSHDAQALGKRPREEDEAPMREAPMRESRPGTTGLLSTGSDQGQGFGSQGGVPHLQTQSLPGMARPRVRARRGQATDPHSIAERLRRERIAERMKALQELVPNSNKTDKASMLDEIIDYVKFLQLQVKVLSMSRLGGAGALAPLVADIPAERENNFSGSTVVSSAGVAGPTQDGLALTERQVTRMMEDDMGSAMQYLQSKGLCLMPISLATAISTTSGSRSKGTAGGDKEINGAPGSSAGDIGVVSTTNGESCLEAEILDEAVSAKSLKGEWKSEDESQGHVH